MAASTTKELCGAKTHQGGQPCKLRAGYGTDHTGVGSCKFHGGSTAAGRKSASLKAAAKLGEGRQIDPHAALELAVAGANGLREFFAEKVAALKAEQLVTGEQLNLWIREYRDQLLELAKISKYAVDAGVAERHVRAIEQWSGPLATLLEAVLRDRELALTDDQLKRAPKVVGRHLRALEAPAVDRVAA